MRAEESRTLVGISKKERKKQQQTNARVNENDLPSTRENHAELQILIVMSSDV